VKLSLLPLLPLLLFTTPSWAAEATCPTEFEPLIEQMLPELPGYANRVIQRSRLPGDRDLLTYVLLAGRPEFEPLPLGTAQSDLGEQGDSDVRQVFVTTLERTYVTDGVREQQGYHWLFLTPSDRGWQLILAFSSIGSYPAGKSITPPEDSTNGIIAQAVRLWLRDCQSF
jgi:hypothetical protein